MNTTEATIAPGSVWVDKSDECNPFGEYIKLRIIKEVRDGFVLYDVRNGIRDRSECLCTAKESSFLGMFSPSLTISASDLDAHQKTNTLT